MSNFAHTNGHLKGVHDNQSVQLPLSARQLAMEHSQFTKFSPITVLVKRAIKKLRVDAGHSMKEGARLLGVSRKQLEDIETIRNYGCHLDLELLAKIKVIYRKSLDEIVGELPDDYYSEYFERPRKELNRVVSTI